MESQPQNAELGRLYWLPLPDKFSVNLKTFDHLNLKIVNICRQIVSFKNGISKVQDLGNFELSPMCLKEHVYLLD